MLRRSSALVLSLTVSLLALTSGCASSGKSSAEDDGPQHYMQRVADAKAQNTGFILAELDGTLRQWSGLVATGDKGKDERRASALQEELRHRSRKHLLLLTQQLESGPVRNRMVSAMAIGFSNAPEALSVLISALEDQDERVEINALIGISVLRSKDTPMSLLTSRMSDHQNPQARAMASSAVVYCLRAGAIGENVDDAARLGLIDEEPVVRTNSALILAELRDSESIDSIALLLYDELPLVRRAARQAITHIGMREDRVRGQAARALTAALERAENDADETSLILYLQKLSSINHGDKVEDWVEWANQMP